MADGRETHIWSHHASEQMAMNKPHHVADDAIFRNWLKEIKPTNIVDYGCGTGLWRYMFAGYIYEGVDQNPDMIAGAKQRFPNEADHFKVITWDNPELGDKSVDVLFTSAVIQHNTHEHKRKILKEFHRIIKDGGHYMCTENTFRPDNVHHVSRTAVYADGFTDGYSFTKNGWERFMNENGFALVKFHPNDMYLWRKV